MQKVIWLLVFSCIISTQAQAQRTCGQQAMFQYFESIHPGSLKNIAAQKAKALAKYSEYSIEKQANSTFKTTSDPILIPVIFHIVLDSNQFNALGGIAGIENRVNSQMKVINDDFNGLNADKIRVPAVWSSLYANMGIGFGLAHVAPDESYSPGYEIKIVPNGTSFSALDGGKKLKFRDSGGTNAWDNSKYLNIWVANLKISSSTILGITAPPGFSEFKAAELGVALNYVCFGKRTSASQNFIKNFDLGRTLTHELGHYFYLWHTWGEEGSSCTDDDGFSDTPFEESETVGRPNFPRFDPCTPAGNGIMFMNYMDYCDDTSMYLFTQQQAAMAKSQIAPGGLSYSLTLHPKLSDTQFKISTKIGIFPNPTRGKIYLKYDNATTPIQRVIVYNLLGQKLIETTEQGINTIDISSFSKGVYFVHCYFEKEVLKEKIILQ